jgi:hypothetical protein
MRQTALLNYQADQAVAGVDQKTEAQVLSDLEAMKDKFPDWVWK